MRRVCIFRIGQLVDYIDELGNAAWPAVGHDQRCGVCARGSAVQEVDSQTVNGRAELTDPVKALFERPPVVAGAPIVHDIDEIGEGNALFPTARVGRGAIDRLGLRQSRRGQSRAQIVEVSVGCVGFKCLHVAG